MRRSSVPSGVILAILLGSMAPMTAQTITHLGNFGASCVSIATGAHSHVLNLTGSIAAGNTVILAISTSANVTSGTITDSNANTYTGDMSFAPSFRVFCASSRLAVGLNMGQQITIPYNNATGSSQTSCAAVSAYSNLVPFDGAYIDQLTNGSGATPSVSVGPTGTTTQANELVIGAFVPAATTTFTQGAGYINMTSACSGICIFSEYKIVAVTGMQTATGTLGGATSWGGIVATYKGCGPDSQTPSVTPPAGVTVTQTTCI